MFTGSPFVEVTVELPVEKTFTYSIPEGLSRYVEVGKRLLVPFGKRVVTSYAIGLGDETPVKDTRAIIDVLDERPIFNEDTLPLYRWMSSYYHAPLGEVLRLTHPPEMNVKGYRYFSLTSAGLKAIQKGEAREVLKAIGRKGKGLSSLLKGFKGCSLYTTLTHLKKEGLIEEETRIRGRPRKGRGGINPFEDMVSHPSPEYQPTEDQAKAITTIMEGIKGNRFSPFLLYGITGSGKTLVYLKVVEEVLKLGRKAILLAPEIGLTPWLVRPIYSRLQKRVAIFHTGLSASERYHEWKRIIDGKVDVVVGTRSALFVPLKGLGLIIIDEEHDPSYKEETGVRYNARDVALMMGKLFKATVVLGSATPSVETFYNAGKGKITPLYLKKRVEDRPLPSVELVDMRGVNQLLSPSLTSILKEGIKNRRQAILFLNRRGFSTSLVCKECGFVFKCLNCSIPFVLHKRERVLRCHYCDLSTPTPDLCPRCKGYRVGQLGSGTERVEEEIKGLFPKARVTRMDRDTTRRKKARQEILNGVEREEVDILVGTQMVTKGHHFPGVTVVGVVSADTALNIPDFRSSERTFQLITQVAGRAGRGPVRGEVIIQTLNPEHYCLQRAITHDYIGFFEEELEKRRDAFYPPFCRLLNLRLEGNSERKVSEAAKRLKEIAIKALSDLKSQIPNPKSQILKILGPAPAFLYKLRGRYRWQVLVKGRDVKALHHLVGVVVAEFHKKRTSGVTLVVDVDPATTL